MSFVDHFADLRKAFIQIAIILLISFIISYSFGAEISSFLLKPLKNVLHDDGKIIFTGVLDKVLSYFQVSFWAAIIISSPVWFYSIWSFIKPGLLEKEVKVIRPFIIGCFFLFIIGVLFGYFLVFPVTFKMLLNFGVADIGAYIDLKSYLVLSIKILVFLGVVFQMPNIILILGLLGIVKIKTLNTNRRYIYIGLSVLAALLTPPDVLTMVGLLIPLMLLYEVGVLAVWIFCREKL